MNRRSFLQRIGIAAIGLTLARHLPGIAPQAPRLAATPDTEWIASEALQVFDRQLKFIHSISRKYDGLSPVTGTTLYLPIPKRFSA